MINAKSYDIYIDESCHLEHDRFPVMCIGYIKIASENYPSLKQRIQEIKLKHHAPTEIKWNHLSESRIQLYKDLIDFFFEYNIEFRCVLVKYKNKLNHKDFNQGSHDSYYYKLVYFLLHSTTNSEKYNYRVLLDIKDTRGKQRLNKLTNVLENTYKGSSPFKYFQHIHSFENEFLQITDLFIGAITYKARRLDEKENASSIKHKIIQYLEQKSGYILDEGTEPWESKFNIFNHQPKSFR